MFRSGLVLLALIIPCYVNAQELPLDKIVKLGKQSTGLVYIKGKGEASSFCVHPDGWFVTNNHVIRVVKPGDAISIVMNPTLETEKVYQASVVRFDRDNDLALLRIDEKVKLPALQLSPSQTLSELDEIIAFGFPLGSGVAVERNAFPAVSVNSGRVTSLRKRSGKLHLVQVDAALNPGNSGGPILNRMGKVVGIVVSGIPGTGINQAIPTEHATQLLNKPDIQLLLPSITAESLHQPLHFSAKVITLQPGTENYNVTLNIKPAAQAMKTFAMKREQDEYRAQATLFSSREAGTQLTLSVLVGGDKLTVKAPADAVLRVDDNNYPLSQIRQYESQPRSMLTLKDGSEIVGPLDTKAKFVVTLLGQDHPIDLNKLTSLKVNRKAVSLPATLSIEAVVTHEGKPIARQEINLAAQGDAYREAVKESPKTPATVKKR